MPVESKDEKFPNDFLVHPEECTPIDLEETNRHLRTAPSLAKGRTKGVKGRVKILSQTQYLEISRLVAEARWKRRC